jgi:hypothetical protein
MKNIHIIPTEKPSRLFYNVGGALLFTDYENYNGVNIYITSDEEIAGLEGDFYIDGDIVRKGANGYKPYMPIRKYFRKIILTTDQDLIKDGVQAIDDEFLEWFVKNPTCEYVELKGYAIILPGESCDCDSMCDECKNKQDNQDLKKYPLTPDECYKQEILEEAAFTAGEEAFKSFKKAILEANRFDYVCGFTAGAKWQQEQMFDIMQQYAAFCVKCDREKLPLLFAKEWFEKFNK